MNLKPLHDRVAIEPIEQENKTKAGLIIPDSAKEKPMQGRVVAVGKGARDDKGNLIPVELKIGDKVLYGKWAGTEVKVGDKELIFMKESDVIAILD